MKDKVVVVTGASTGIGMCLANELVARQCNVVIAARRETELAKVAKPLGDRALMVVSDVTQRAEVEKIMAAAVKRFGKVDVWVNNVGRALTRQVADLTDDDVDQMITINLKSALYGMQVPTQHFRANGQGHIINVSSMLGRIPMASIRSAYSAAKAALNSLTCNLRVDLAATHPNIFVSLILPGVVATEFGSVALHGGPDSRKLPFAQPPEEVAKIIADCIERPQAEVYSRPNMRAQVAEYYAAEDVTLLEKNFPPIVPVR